jgi:hypothetical protein
MKNLLTLIFLVLLCTTSLVLAKEPQQFNNPAFQYSIALPAGWEPKISDYRTPPQLDGHLVHIDNQNNLSLSIEAIPTTKESFDQTWSRMLRPEKNFKLDYGDIVIAETNAKWALSYQDTLLKMYVLSYLIPGKDYNYSIVIMGWNYDNYKEDRKAYEDILKGLKLY